MAFKEVVWVGRLSGPKGELAYQLAYVIFPRFPGTKFTLVGGPTRPAGWPVPAGNVDFVGQVADVGPYYARADLVIGAGRVAMEAMLRHKPVMAVGEGCYVGLINAASIKLAKATNFGDCLSPPQLDYERLAQDLQAFLTGDILVDPGQYQALLREYDRLYVNRLIRDSVYRQAVATAALRGFREVPVLMYHRVVDRSFAGSKHGIHTTRARLRAHFNSLRRRGYEPLTFKDLAEGRRVAKPIILTFDDGYQDNFDHLLPLLEEFGYKAVIFVLGDRSITSNRWDSQDGEPAIPLMNDEQIRRCQASGRIEIASHGMTHRNLVALDDLAARHEILSSKASLENLIADEVVSFASPYGVYSDREVELIKEAGYLFGIGTVNGPLRLIDDLYRIRRIQIRPRDKGIKFWHKTCGYYLRYCQFKKKDF